jgi:hypothetical protein
MAWKNGERLLIAKAYLNWRPVFSRCVERKVAALGFSVTTAVSRKRQDIAGALSNDRALLLEVCCCSNP